ncbi:MAG: transcription antitermination factor NusB [Spirochaetaceae bacterium]|jgi:N utilization substance protein B|nr:transcription antitermination factor NusB [Spirochaetaceae bacterium]
MASRRRSRILAFQALYSWEASYNSGEAPPQVVPEAILNFSWLESEKRDALDDATRDFSRLLITGAIENIDSVDKLIKGHLKNWDFSRVNRVDLALLRLSVYTLLFQTDIPPSIVIDEAIGISKDFGTDDSFRFINGVLDSIRKTIQEKKNPEGGASP